MTPPKLTGCFGMALRQSREAGGWFDLGKDVFVVC